MSEMSTSAAIQRIRDLLEADAARATDELARIPAELQSRERSRIIKEHFDRTAALRGELVAFLEATTGASAREFARGGIAHIDAPPLPEGAVGRRMPDGRLLYDADWFGRKLREGAMSVVSVTIGADGAITRD